jgi:hypothetical protein
MATAAVRGADWVEPYLVEPERWTRLPAPSRCQIRGRGPTKFPRGIGVDPVVGTQGEQNRTRRSPRQVKIPDFETLPPFRAPAHPINVRGLSQSCGHIAANLAVGQGKTNALLVGRASTWTAVAFVKLAWLFYNDEIYTKPRCHCKTPPALAALL